jgi:hypothetical protein
MPDISDVDFPLINRLAVRLMVPEPGISSKATLYRNIFIRLQDKAIREYRQAREAFLADIADHGRQMHIIEFTDHMETCINATSRLYRLLEKIKSERESPAFPKELRKSVETKGPSVKVVRDTVEHMDKEIQGDKVTPGKPIALTVNKNFDGVLASSSELSFQDLAEVLKKFNEIALYILGIKKMPTSGPVVR